MKSLIKTVDRRRLSLIESLIETNDWITLKELAQRLDISTRNLKYDIAYLREANPDIQIETSSKGIRIQTEFSTGMTKFYMDVLKSNLTFKILEEIFFDESLSVKDLAVKFKSSMSTIYRVIDQVNDYFAPYDCRVESNPCRFVGDEHYIRNFYRAYFNEVSSILEWPFRHYKREQFDHALDLILDFLHQFKDFDFDLADFAFYEIVKTILMVNIIRYQNGHLVPTESNKNIYFTILSRILKLFSLQKELKEIGVHPINSESIYQTFHPYFKKNLAYSAEAVAKVRKKDSRAEDAMAYTEAFLLSYSEYIDIDIDVNHVMVMLYGTTFLEDDDPNAHYVLYNRNKLFVHRLKQEYPHIHHAFHSVIVEYRKRIGLNLDEDKVNLHIYTLFTNWENLLVDLHAKYYNVSLLVISDGHYSHAKMIEKLLKFELRDYLTIETYRHRELSVDRLNASDADIIISTFKLPDTIGKLTVIIDHYPSFSDLSRIKTTIQHVLEEKVEKYWESEFEF